MRTSSPTRREIRQAFAVAVLVPWTLLGKPDDGGSVAGHGGPQGLVLKLEAATLENVRDPGVITTAPWCVAPDIVGTTPQVLD